MSEFLSAWYEFLPHNSSLNELSWETGDDFTAFQMFPPPPARRVAMNRKKARKERDNRRRLSEVTLEGDRG